MGREGHRSTSWVARITRKETLRDSQLLEMNERELTDDCDLFYRLLIDCLSVSCMAKAKVPL